MSVGCYDLMCCMIPFNARLCLRIVFQDTILCSISCWVGFSHKLVSVCVIRSMYGAGGVWDGFTVQTCIFMCILPPVTFPKYSDGIDGEISVCTSSTTFARFDNLIEFRLSKMNPVFFSRCVI